MRTAFENTKKALVAVTLQVHLRYNVQILLAMDASDNAIGVVL